MEPVSVGRQLNDLDCGKPLRRVGRRVSQRLEFAAGHQNLNVMLGKAQKSGGCRNIQTAGQAPCGPSRQRLLEPVAIHGRATFHSSPPLANIRTLARRPRATKTAKDSRALCLVVRNWITP